MNKTWLYYSAAFLAAFLLFQIQPMASKSLLPLFGGSYLVWGSCMVFFQGMLLIGYLYAHVIQRWVGVFTYSRLHWLILLVPLVFFPFDFSRFADSVASRPLAFNVFWFLFSTVSVPVIVLSTASLILQRWLSVSSLPQRENPYALYAVSNLGSMLALLTYPVLVEPFFNLKLQGLVWWSAYLVFVLLHILCMPERAGAGEKEKVIPPGRVPAANVIQWLMLGAAGCVLLLAVTNVITLDIASVPFLWVLPLSVYLLSFVLTFKRNLWYPQWMERILPWSMIFGMLLYLMTQLRLALPAWLAIIMYLFILFVICLSCNARLVEIKPGNAVHLTSYYLLIAAGGFLGSALVSWVMPLVSKSLVEYPLAFVFAGAALAAGVKRPADQDARLTARSMFATFSSLAFIVLALTFIPWWAGRFLGVSGEHGGLVFILIAVPVAVILRLNTNQPLRFCLILLTAAIAMFWTEDNLVGAGRVINLRNFYGIYKVFDVGNIRYLKHGTTQHGRQYLSGLKTETPLAYYHPTTPAAEVLQSHAFRFHRIGMVGLGTGALASYTGKNQKFVVYELDPDNLKLAKDNFTYLGIAERKGAGLTYVFGDGRVSLGKEEPASLDLLIIDAFNSGAIPVHLLTVEAFEVYLRAVGRDGLVLLHVSNKVLNLIPVVYSNAQSVAAAACEKDNAGSLNPDADETYWMALTRNPATHEILIRKMGWKEKNLSPNQIPKPWTDQISNILGAMLRQHAP
jgi:hypothetical protein